MQTKQILINEKLQLKKSNASQRYLSLALSLSPCLALSRSNPGLLQLCAIFHYAEAQKVQKKERKNAIKMLPSKCIKKQGTTHTHTHTH